MRLSKTALLVLGIGIFIIAFASLFTLSSGQSAEQEQLNEKLATAQGLLPKLVDEGEDLAGQLTQWEKRVTEATSLLNRSEARFPKSVDSIDYDQTLFQIADNCGLQVINITASEPAEKRVKNITYAVTSFRVKVRSEETPPSTVAAFESYIDATVRDILDFINEIATSEDFGNATVKLVDMKKLEPPEDIIGGETGPEAAVELTIYGFQR